MNTPESYTPGRPLLICGMHRSGTSLTASLFDAAGVRLGDRLLGADVGNARGHYEDMEIYEFHRSALRACGCGTEGFVASGPVVVPELLQPIGRRLAADRERAGVPWGWKEPRTVLFLDYWDTVLPDARYVFVFRPPWEVVDSLFRRGDETFAGNPAFAAEVWLHYNRTILEFVRRHEDRCLLVELNQVTADPRGLFAAVRSRLGFDLPDPPDLFEPPLLVRDEEPRRAAAIGTCLPEAIAIYDALRERAGSGAREPLAAAESAALGRGLLAEWRQARRTEAEAAAAVARLVGARHEAAAAEATALTLRTRVASLENELRALQTKSRSQADRISILESELQVEAARTGQIAELEADLAARVTEAAAGQAAMVGDELAALRSELARRSSTLEVVATRLHSRDGSVLRRMRREIARIAHQATAALRRLTSRRPVGETPQSGAGHSEAA